MPTTYAHYTFGNKVLDTLDAEVKQLIKTHLPLFHIGLHGPDILFYYIPLKSYNINKTGSKIHKETADKFISRGKKIIKYCPDREKATVYLLGFICHFMLDSECHPYINYRTSISNVSHLEMEAEFDRMLMLEDNLNPLKFKPTKHIICDKECSTCISWFYKGISKNSIFSTLKSMKLFLNFLVPSNPLKIGILKVAFRLSGSYKKLNGLIIKKGANPKYKEDCLYLKHKYLDAVLPTASLIHEFYKNLNSNKLLNERFRRNFE